MPSEKVELLFNHLNNRRDELAFAIDDRQLTFGELDDRALRYAAGLAQLGIEKGDRVVTILDSSLELVEILVGHHRLGAVHVPVNTRYRKEELTHIIDDARPAAVVVGAGLAARKIVGELELPDSVRNVIVVGNTTLTAHELSFSEVAKNKPLAGLPELDDQDLALFIYTSGTTGPSKGVEHTYSSVVSGIDALTRHWQWTPKDRLVLALPLFHVHGLCIGIHGTLIRGNDTIIHQRFDPAKVARAIGRGGTIFMGVPTMHTRLVAAMDNDPELAEAMSNARLITSGSAALREDIFRRYEELTGQRILERYGMSETMLTISNPYEGERRRGSVGFPVPGTEVRIADEEDKPLGPGEVGEIQVRGPSVMRSYWGLPEKTACQFTVDRFFRTGDVGRRDKDGYIYIVGRRSVDIIKSGGFKISAREIEGVLRRHPDIDDVGVVGLPDEEWGQRIAAAIVPANGIIRTSEQWASQLATLCEEHLADFKRPREFFTYSDGLPRNALGKVQKHRIIEDLQKIS